VDPIQHFSVRVEEEDCCAIFHMDGELDIASVGLLEASVVDSAHHEHAIFDCDQLTFIDSSGLRALLAAHEQWQGKVALIRTHRIVDKAIAVTGLTEMLNVVHTLEEAKKALHL
jgi:anti-anti-sigma factor